MKTVAIIGSREFPRPELVREFVRTLRAGTVVVTGGWWRVADAIFPTRGVDWIAAAAAEECGLTVAVVAGSVTKHGRAAGMVRNPVVVGLADEVVAFWDGASPGTAAALKAARKLGKPVRVIGPEEE